MLKESMIACLHYHAYMHWIGTYHWIHKNVNQKPRKIDFCYIPAKSCMHIIPGLVRREITKTSPQRLRRTITTRAEYQAEFFSIEGQDWTMFFAEVVLGYTRSLHNVACAS